jgi:cell division protein YceG involved in septum cleavage
MRPASKLPKPGARPALAVQSAGAHDQQERQAEAGSYELKPGSTPLRLIDQLARGEFAQEQLTIIEGWTFRQMRAAIAAHQGPEARHHCAPTRS